MTIPKTHQPTIYRHPRFVRVFHWINALCFVILILSGFQIFNSHPRLYVGNSGYFDQPAILEITGNKSLDNPRSWIQIGDVRIPTTGFLGVPEYHPSVGVYSAAFPSYLRIPWQTHLGYGRGWHFLMVWIFAANLIVYLALGIFSRRLFREMLPTKAQLGLAAIWQDVWTHIRFRRVKGDAARSYNLLQKLSYLVVTLVLLPTMVLSGMAITATGRAAFPWLLDLFQGFQTARTMHFTSALLLLGFLCIHIAMVFVTGVRNQMRSMITGYYRIPEDRTP